MSILLAKRLTSGIPAHLVILIGAVSVAVGSGCGDSGSSDRRQGKKANNTNDADQVGDTNGDGTDPQQQPDTPDGAMDGDDSGIVTGGATATGTGTDTSTDTGVAAVPDLSGGSGGLAPGDYRDLPFKSDGIATTFHLYVPAGTGYGVMVYLHGDGGGGYTSNYKGRVKDVRRIAEERKLLLINIKSPFSMSDGSPSWRSGNTAGSAKLVHSLVQDEVYRKYPVDKRRFFITGHSGGPTFITSVFVPAFGRHYRGGAIPVCGGVAPAKNALQTTPEFLQNFKMYFHTETGDFMYQYMPRAVQRYKDAGFQVTDVHPDGTGHCDVDSYQVLADALNTIDR